MERAYLARHLFDGQRLRERALDEFSSAARTGRLIAFVGSYATQKIGSGAGYGTWSDFLKRLAQEAISLCRNDGHPDRKEHAVKAIEAIVSSLDGSNAPTGLSVIEYALSYASKSPNELVRKLQTLAANRFELPKADPKDRNNIQRIIDDMSIDRIITLNYDMEFEWELMTTGEEKKGAGTDDKGRQTVMRAIIDGPNVIRKERGTLARILPNGKSVISDLFMRERTDRLIEFAVGSPDYESHILHLHGRRDVPDSMVISQRDYNNQYRRSGVAKLPFEHALRILFAGNPILFIGIGMQEGEVTATLEQFISDHPNRRIAPVFILWNAPAPDKTTGTDPRDAMRFRWLHRFGALTLFDDEIEPRHVTPSGDPFVRLGQSIENAGYAAAQRAAVFEWRKEDLRQIADKLAGANAQSPHIDVWPTARDDEIIVRPKASEWAQSGQPLQIFIGEPGAGKGHLAKELRQAWHDRPGDGMRRSCLINASFVFELDSVFSLISGLADNIPAGDQSISRLKSLEAFLTSEMDGELLIVINGMERFLSPTGAPLSSELDSLIRLSVEYALEQHRTKLSPAGDADLAEPGSSQPVRRHNVTIFVLGTSRVRRYFSALTERISHDLMRPGRPDSIARYLSDETAEADGPPRRYTSAYFNRVAERFRDADCDEAALARGAIARIREKLFDEPTGLRRVFLSAYLQPDALRNAGAEHPDLCLDILTTMAIIGQPVEAGILVHCPRVLKRLDSIGDGTTHRGSIETAFATLTALGLVIATTPFPGSPAGWQRYALHRAVLTQLRDRLSVPLTDAQLSAGFNLSTLIALPSDGYSPEREMHEELGTLVDWLGGAYQDEPLGGAAALETSSGQRDWSPAQRRRIKNIMFKDREVQHRRAWPHVAACLRAALAILRSYYSTSTLLMVDPTGDVPKPDEDGPLTQHADRLDRLMVVARRTVEARREVRTLLGTEQLWLGPSPFYADDLIWLHNERGVVKLAQGDLYEARLSFLEALRLNREHVEFGDRLHNWRRIMLNQVHLDIERAWLDRAEKRMSKIEDSIELLVAVPIADIRATIFEQYAGSSSDHRCWVDPIYERDFIVSIALIHGYRGLILNLQGQLDAARDLLQRAVIVLDNLGEVRAHATFLGHLTALLTTISDGPEVDEAVRTTLVAGESTKQADIAHHARVVSAAQRAKRASVDGRAAITQQLRSSLNYAEAADMHRLRIEAGLNLARIKLDSGDFDVALEYAADALATASRYGLNLRKISLRVLIGQILMARGDPISGRALIDKAIKSAERVGYHTAIELAQRVLAAQGLAAREV